MEINNDKSKLRLVEREEGGQERVKNVSKVEGHCYQSVKI